ncbi:hypothetical protein ZOD2009_21057 [Haladaptatus paucihalophilus DX253]|uniref:Uncharacterized protein n=1 Tax=Haladaptatus paucihalophilus DX253 TaxID=797209 RepID=E7QZK2_HALPU|nr:hypothetical protein [Haladaptatus paucihalophilus]EFW90123.1 hypothetical protein ZOD2009_21057 [Haladaptatus paucihalophilus DX253]SHL06241.1 hypothetical protein SAMN05444342_2888 [Haladaptatus paucihalophilus DX253]
MHSSRQLTGYRSGTESVIAVNYDINTDHYDPHTAAYHHHEQSDHYDIETNHYNRDSHDDEFSTNDVAEFNDAERKVGRMVHYSRFHE